MFEKEEMQVETLEDGYVRVTVKIYAPAIQAFRVVGIEAQKRFVKWILWTAAGLVPRWIPEVTEIISGMPDDSSDPAAPSNLS